jgi:acetyl-CoA carboxylase biotin carboxyl carrier protein
MDSKEIEKLMIAMQKHGAKRISIKREGFEIELEREDNRPQLPPDLLHVAALKVVEDRHRSLLDLPRVEEGQRALPPPSHHPKTQQQEGNFVTSPMVGTFYLSPSPQDPPFVKVGDKVEAHTVVAIIEAMKVMNEIKAGVAGTIQEVLHESGHPVEFGSKLFRVT